MPSKFTPDSEEFKQEIIDALKKSGLMGNYNKDDVHFEVIKLGAPGKQSKSAGKFSYPDFTTKASVKPKNDYSLAIADTLAQSQRVIREMTILNEMQTALIIAMQEEK